MPIDELFSFTRIFQDISQYTQKRAQLLSAGFDYIRIIESDGRCDMFVVLNFDKAEIDKE